MEYNPDTSNATPTPQTNPKAKGYDGLELVELASVILAVGGSLAGAVMQNIAVASIPLSASVALNFYNRKRLIEAGDHTVNSKVIQLAQYSKNKLENLTQQVEEINTNVSENNQKTLTEIETLAQQFKELQESALNHQTNIDQLKQDVKEIKEVSIQDLIERGQLLQDNSHNKNQITNLSAQLQEIQQFTIADLIEQSRTHQENLESLSVKLQEVQQTALTELSKQSQQQQQSLKKLAGQLSQVNSLTSNLKEDTDKLHEFTKNIDDKHQELAGVVECLKEIETKNQFLKAEQNVDNSYFDLGLNHERLGDYQVAINDFSDAIKANPTYAKAYYHRGVLRNKMGDKQGALDDLRESAKHYFEQGDIPNYQKAKELAKEIHHIGGKQEEKSPNVAVGGLFE